MKRFPYALLILDCQNDLCHSDGVYAKHGLAAPQVNSIIHPITEAIIFCRKMQIPTIATQLTILQDLQKNAIVPDQLKKQRPFLEYEGLRKDTWGHDLLEGIPPVDYKILKWSLSTFYNTELLHYLQALQIQELILTGFTTNGVVETAAREAVGRNFKIITLTDCVQSYSEILHQASLSNLKGFGQILTSQQWQNSYVETMQCQ